MQQDADKPGCKVLLVAIEPAILETMSLLARAMAADQRLQPIILIRSTENKGKARELCGPGIEIFCIDQVPWPAKSDSLSMPAWAVWLWALLRRMKIRGRFVHRWIHILEIMNDLSRHRLRARQILAQINPQALLVGDDRRAGFLAAILKEAKIRKCFILLVCYAVSHCRDELVPTRDGHPGFDLNAPRDRFLKKWIARRLPLQVFMSQAGPYLFYQAHPTMALHFMMMLSEDPWCVGGGLSDKVALTGEGDLQRYIKGGMDPSKLAVVGQPSLDTLFDSAREKDKLTEKLNLGYGFDSQKKLLICAVPQLAEHHVFDWETHWKEMDFLVNSLAGTGLNVLLSLHPKSQPEAYLKFEEKPNVRVAFEPLSTILPAGDIFVATFSSTVRWAVLLGIPTLVVDFYGFDYSVYDSLGGVKIVSNREKLSPALHNLAIDQVYYQNQVEQALKTAPEVAPFDGLARQRIIDLVWQQVGHKGGA
jgi:hypothetical protein